MRFQITPKTPKVLPSRPVTWHLTTLPSEALNVFSTSLCFNPLENKHISSSDRFPLKPTGGKRRNKTLTKWKSKVLQGHVPRYGSPPGPPANGQGLPRSRWRAVRKIGPPVERLESEYQLFSVVSFSRGFPLPTKTRGEKGTGGPMEGTPSKNPSNRWFPIQQSPDPRFKDKPSVILPGSSSVGTWIFQVPPANFQARCFASNQKDRGPTDFWGPRKKRNPIHMPKKGGIPSKECPLWLEFIWGVNSASGQPAENKPSRYRSQSLFGQRSQRFSVVGEKIIRRSACAQTKVSSPQTYFTFQHQPTKRNSRYQGPNGGNSRVLTINWF